jgi:hypothetical protein
MTAPEPKNTRERIAQFLSLKGGVTRCGKGLIYILGCWMIMVILAGLIALASGTSDLQPEIGDTYHVYIARRGGGAWVYVKPWIGRFYDFMFWGMFIYFAVLLLFALFLVIARRILGDPRHGPDMRRGFWPTDQP